ncbi:thioesterase family protein [uncultured Marinobacter sp.]|uniref:thioesterase family protein n=1 Tax=uncultured Marinobacter sp. TaxID=187379 RepID=UPI0030D7911B
MPDTDSAVYVRSDDLYVPTALSRGPWSAEAQHGGAPAALLAGLAEAEVNDPDMFLSRLTMELVRPVPIAPLAVATTMGRGNSVRRVELALSHDGVVVARAIALFLRQQPLQLPTAGQAQSAPMPMPAPDTCHQRFSVPGMPRVTSFYETAMDIRVAGGNVGKPGPASAWFRFARPLLEGMPISGGMGAVAASDFGNGLSWMLPVEDYTFVNTDLTVYLHRNPVSEWVGVDSKMTVEANGVGLVRSDLYDEHGPVGIAQQNLFVRSRSS